MKRKIDVDMFVKNNQEQITCLVNNSLNKAGKKIQEKVDQGELGANIQEVLPLLLYEVLVTNTVATLRLVAEMINEESQGNGIHQPEGCKC